MNKQKYTAKYIDKIKKGVAVLIITALSAGSLTPILLSSSYIANADDSTTTSTSSMVNGNTSSSTSTSSDTTTIGGDQNSSASTTIGTTTMSTSTNGSSTDNSNPWWWLHIPTPPTPPTPLWWTNPGSGTSTGSTTTGSSTWPWNFPTPPTPPTYPPWWNTGTSTMGTTTTGTTTNSTTSTSTVTVTILKFINGQMATASSSQNMDFLMTANYNSTTTGQGTGNYNLSASGYNGDPTPYKAVTTNFAPGASYSTYENMNNVTGMTCNVATSSASTTPFALVGYTTGQTMSQAMSGTPTTTVPSFPNLTTNEYVIVWNQSCGNSGMGSGGSGSIGGTVTGGATSSVGVLNVDSIVAQNATGTADGTFANGWKYIFNITAPTNEPDLAMKFADWMNTSGSSTIPVANNVRISSAQANSSSTATVTAANTYTTPFLHIIQDLNPSVIGNQIQVLVESLIPINSVNGTYTTNYGVKTQ